MPRAFAVKENMRIKEVCPTCMADDESMCTPFAFKQLLNLKCMLQAKNTGAYKCRSYIPVNSVGATFNGLYINITSASLFTKFCTKTSAWYLRLGCLCVDARIKGIFTAARTWAITMWEQGSMKSHTIFMWFHILMTEVRLCHRAGRSIGTKWPSWQIEKPLSNIHTCKK